MAEKHTPGAERAQYREPGPDCRYNGEMPNSLSDLLWLVLVGAGAWYWWITRNAKTLALRMAWHRCRELNLQLLDQSVVLRKTRVQRGDDGVLQLRRYYDFEFSSTGEERYRGSLVMAGSRLIEFELAAHVLQ